MTNDTVNPEFSKIMIDTRRRIEPSFVVTPYALGNDMTKNTVNPEFSEPSFVVTLHELTAQSVNYVHYAWTTTASFEDLVKRSIDAAVEEVLQQEVVRPMPTILAAEEPMLLPPTNSPRRLDSDKIGGLRHR
jgi:small-conductance mechanosensitive channel